MDLSEWNNGVLIICTENICSAICKTAQVCTLQYSASYFISIYSILDLLQCPHMVLFIPGLVFKGLRFTWLLVHWRKIVVQYIQKSAFRESETLN